MIYVFASVKTRPGTRSQALDIYRSFAPEVLAREQGCLEYSPSVDLDLGLANQEIDTDLIMIFERWESIDDFRAHLAMPHTLLFRADISAYLAKSISVKITQKAF